MTSADAFALAVFLVAALAGLLIILWQARGARHPQVRIRARIENLDRQDDEAAQDEGPYVARVRARLRARAMLSPALRSIILFGDRIRSWGGTAAWVKLSLAIGAGMVVAIIIAVLADLPWWISAALLPALPAAAWGWTYAALVRRFKNDFRAQLPQAIDMIMRASMAGVPPTQAIRNVGDDMAAPLGPEFRHIGDSLYLGEDLDSVMLDAMERIDIPEFSFFAVYLMVQRSTGGSMGETLQNLSAVIRTRAELELKVRAMTAEGRTSSLVMAILPFAVLGIMFVVNRDYARILFETGPGRILLSVSLGMIVVGMLLIRRMARLED